MEAAEEYHDPDYLGTTIPATEEPKKLDEVDKVQKINHIIRREFANEIEARENEIKLVDQRVSSARHLLHRLRLVLVTRYYQDQKLQLNPGHIQDEVAAQTEPKTKAEVSSLLRDGQRRLHPSVRKLLGRQTVDLHEILRHRAPRNKTRKDYSAMVQTRNYTIPADKTTSLRPASSKRPSTEEPVRPRKVPRHLEPKVENVVTLDEITRNRQKHRFRIIIGNTSKYAPAASPADASTHKWLLYVRHADLTVPGASTQGASGQEASATRGGVVTSVSAELHHSYAPHHRVTVDKPPFHISRRGWGEFPAKITLHFSLPERNKPATIEHTIKLDRNYTGLQTLGAETIVDVWLYSNEDMMQYEFKEEYTLPPLLEPLPPQLAPPVPLGPPAEVKSEPIEPPPSLDLADANQQVDNWLDFFNNETTELDVDEMIIKAVKKENNIDNLMDTSLQTGILDNRLDSTEINPEQTLNIEKEIKQDTFANDTIVKTEHIENDEDLSKAMIEMNAPNELVNQPTKPKKRIMKYMDPNTGKIYYLEMDRNLDLSKVQEIVINSKGNTKTAKISPVKANGLKSVRRTPKKGVSLLKPEVNNYLKTEKKVRETSKSKNSFKHIENDHCYLGQAWAKNVFSNAEPVLPDVSKNLQEVQDEVTIKIEEVSVVESRVNLYDCLCEAVKRFSCVRVAVNYLLGKIPLISDIKDSATMKYFPFTVDSENVYWNLDFAKRRNIEWSRAKLINKILTQHSNIEPVWRTKQILLFSRLHGYHPIRDQKNNILDTEDWSTWTDIENSQKLEANLKEMYSKTSVNGLSIFNPEDFPTETDVQDAIDLTEPEEEVEVVFDSPVKVKKEVLPEVNTLQVLPVESEEDRMRFLFVERKCADIGIELRNEDVGSGYCYSAVHAVLLTAMKKFAEEILRKSLAAKLTENMSLDDPPIPVWNSPQSAVSIGCTEVVAATRRSRLDTLCARDLATNRRDFT